MDFNPNLILNLFHIPAAAFLFYISLQTSIRELLKKWTKSTSGRGFQQSPVYTFFLLLLLSKPFMYMP